jgi:hypothetical protein
VQIAALDQPHRHEEPSIDLAEVMDRHHVRLVERRGGSRFAPETFLEYSVVGVLGGQNL